MASSGFIEAIADVVLPADTGVPTAAAIGLAIFLLPMPYRVISVLQVQARDAVAPRQQIAPQVHQRW